MGSHFSAPVKIRSERTTRGILALLLVIGVLAVITITGSGIAGAANLSGRFSPRVYGGMVDVNGDGEVTSDDNADFFFRETDLVQGKLDCDNWGLTKNAGSAGDNGTDDDCILQAYDATLSGGLFLIVEDGVIDHLENANGDSFDVPEGWQMPSLYKTGATVTSTLPSYGSGGWAWNAIDGKIDWNHSGSFTSSDCKDNVVGTIDLCTDDGGKTNLGYIDINDDDVIDRSDSCYTGCFFGYNILSGRLQMERGFEGTPGTIGSPGPAGKDGVSGRVSIISSSSTNSLNKSKSATCSGTTKVLGGGYNLVGTTATLAHLTVVANGPVSGGWRVRVIEATPTTGTWSVDVSAICATA